MSRRGGTVLPTVIILTVIMFLVMTVLAQLGLLPTGPGQ